jgi:hypothetical protein
MVTQLAEQRRSASRREVRTTLDVAVEDVDVAAGE